MHRGIGRMRNRGLAGLSAVFAVTCVAAFGATTAYAGPVLTMGIDAEDGGPGSHGPTQVYSDTLSAGVLAKTTNGGNGILVIGGGKGPTDDVTQFWNLVGTQTGETISYVNGAANISAQSFAGFQVLGVASSVTETSDGGLTQAENDALAGRQGAVAAFVNAGGGLVGFSQTGLTNPYAYLPDAGQYTFNTGLGFSDIEATPEGEAVGLNDTSLDVSAWHDEYLTFPSYLSVLATNVDTGKAVALGGSAVTLPEHCTNGQDDDGDGLVDGDDPNCVTLPSYKESCGLTINGKSETGTGASETITGTARGDELRGGGGNDRIDGLEDPDCLFGNADKDVINGGAGGDVIRAGNGRDSVKGDDGDDDIRLQDGRDKAKGGEGDDRIKAQGQRRNEGGVDKVNCGSGEDTAIVDRWDKVSRNCEKVKVVN